MIYCIIWSFKNKYINFKLNTIYKRAVSYTGYGDNDIKNNSLTDEKKQMKKKIDHTMNE